MPPRNRATALSVTTEVRDLVNRTNLELSAKVGRRLSASDVVGAAVQIALNHPVDFEALLTTPPEAEPAV